MSEEKIMNRRELVRLCTYQPTCVGAYACAVVNVIAFVSVRG